MIVVKGQDCRPRDSVIQNFQSAASEIAASGHMAHGKYTALFEEEFEQVQGLGGMIACSSGTSALEIALQTLDYASKEVLVPSNTVPPTPWGAIHGGAQSIRWMDTAPGLPVVSLQQIQEAYTDRTSAVIVVHCGGLIPPDMDQIAEFCREENLLLIEDCAHAHGCLLNGQPAGSWGDAAAWSFYSTKVLAAGEGGMVRFKDPRNIPVARMILNQGKNPDSVWQTEGWNLRISEFNAAMGWAQCKGASYTFGLRNRQGAAYQKMLANLGTVESVIDDLPGGVYSTYYKYLVRTKGPAKEWVESLKKLGVHCPQGTYAVPCHSTPAFEDRGFTSFSLGNTEEFADRHFALPVHLEMGDREMNAVNVALKAVDRKLR